MKLLKKTLRVSLALSLLSISLLAENNTTTTEVQDMSDPLAVYTQGGFGISDRGLNLKVGQAYDTGNPKTMGMNLIEIKGILGDTLGFRDNNELAYKNVKNSVEAIRFRNFSINIESGLGSQLDILYNVARESATASYSLIQALPAFGGLNLYPLAGLGVEISNNALQDDGTTASGYTMPGTFAMLGMYAKYALTDKIWFNYNPTWLTTLSGSDVYKEDAYGKGNNSVLLHEIVASYQINPKLNVRYFSNFTQYNNFEDGEHRIEVNYQF